MTADASIRSSAAAIAVGSLAVGLLTLLVVLIRAGGDPGDPANWLVQWELRSSDNGVLIQFLQDVVAGRTLDWSFSPQVFVFPELPASALAFAVSGGGTYGYYIAVAVIDNVLLFVTLVGLVRVLFPEARPRETVLRAAIAAAPLLVFPLIGTSWILSFHLAPTYYFGMYLALLAGPILLLTRSTGVRISLGIALALTVASNPLTLVFAAPGAAAAVVLLLIRAGWRAALRPAVGLAVLLAVAAVIRLLFTPLQGTSPFTYVDAEVFAGRLASIVPYFEYQALDPAMRVILATGIALAFACLLAALAAVVFVIATRRRGPVDPRVLAAIYLALVPLGGIAASYALMITHYLYFWPVLVLPFVLVLLAVPRVALPTALMTVSAAFAAVLLTTGLLAGNLGHLDRYIGYRSSETACIDAAVPGGAVGYATFSDARRLSMTSASRFRLIQVSADVEPHHWLTNRAYSRTEAGTFFYVNGRGDELPIDTAVLTDEFGAADRMVTCGDGQTIWIYTSRAKLAAIADFYRP